MTGTHTNPYRILIVDDEAAICELLAEILKSPTRSIEVRDTARGALEFIAQNPVDLAFLDINIPGMSGLDVARADYWPRVDGFARYGTRSGLPYDQEKESKALDHETSWATGVQLDIPLFRGGAVRAQVAQARLRIDQARERLRDVELLIGEDVDRAWTSLSDSRNRIEVTGKNVEAAAETLRIEQTTYQEGRNTINDVLDAQAARLTADVEHSQAVVDYLLARLDWERALGSDLAAFIAGDSTTQE